MLYEALTLIGGIGLLAQAALGFGHAAHGGQGHGGHQAEALESHFHFGGHGGHGSHSGHAGHAQSQGKMGNHAHGRGGGGGRDAATAFALTLLSPLTIFSLCLGTGATGLLAHGPLRAAQPIVLLVVALVGGILFYSLGVRPLWNLALKFASKPAESLAGTLAKEGVAASRFDARGRGIVRLSMDGQSVRVLAHLDAQDREKGVQVASGDRLLVTSVDGANNSCTVTRL